MDTVSTALRYTLRHALRVARGADTAPLAWAVEAATGDDPIAVASRDPDASASTLHDLLGAIGAVDAAFAIYTACLHVSTWTPYPCDLCGGCRAAASRAPSVTVPMVLTAAVYWREEASGR